MTQPFRTFAGLFAAASLMLAATASFAQDKPDDQIRIGLQKSSTLIAVLRANGELDKALAPLGVKVSWHEFSSGLPLLESLGVGNLDFGADVADTVPIFAQAAGSKLAYVAEESASPAAQAILVAKDSPIKTLADLKGKKIAVTKGAGSPLSAARRSCQGRADFQRHLARLSGTCRRTRGIRQQQCRRLGGVGSVPDQRAAAVRRNRSQRRQRRPRKLQALLSCLGNLCGSPQRRAEHRVRQAARHRPSG